MQKEVEEVKPLVMRHVLQQQSVVRVVVVEEKMALQEIQIQGVLLIKRLLCPRLYNLLVLEIPVVLEILVVCLLTDKELEVVEQVVLEILHLRTVEQVEMVKMLLLFLDQHRNLFILQTDQMLEHQIKVFLLVVVEVDSVLHQETLIEMEQVDQVVAEMVVHQVEVLLLLDLVLQVQVVEEEQVLDQFLILEQVPVQVEVVDQVLF